MPVRLHKPTSGGGRRHSSVSEFRDITAKTPFKKLLKIHKSRAGRNMYGKITVRHRGGGVKKFYRMIDFKQDKFDIPAKVATIEYNPMVDARIALLHYRDGEKRYMLAPVGLKAGESILSSKQRIEMKPGNRMPLEVMPQGTIVYNVEMIPGGGGRIARSAGSSVKLMAIDGEHALLRMPSTEIRMVNKKCLATVGQVSNPDAMHVRLGKAGRMRFLGIRPRVRGKAMNPVDHPHGGGEGHNPIGMKYPKTPWGKPALGVKTRDKKRKSNRFIVSRRGKG